MIPERLRRAEFRFIKIKSKDKAPLEVSWQKENNYRWDDPALQGHLAEGGNYGVATGYGGLLVVDLDSMDFIAKNLSRFPKTFCVATGSGKLHLYYTTDDPRSFKVGASDGSTVADIQGRGKQVVGAGSIHPCGKEYCVREDNPIAHVEISQIRQLFSKYLLNWQQIKSKHDYGQDVVRDEIKQRYLVKDALHELGVNVNRNPTECPFHDSQGGRCLGYTETVWHCFHCDRKGDVFALLMEHYNKSFFEVKQTLADRLGIIRGQEKNKTKDQLLIENACNIALKNTIDLKTQISKGVPEINWLVKNIIPERSIVILGATAGSYKTYICQHLALCLATGDDFFEEFPSKQCNVLYVDEENGLVLLTRRFSQLLNGMDIEDAPSNLYVNSFEGIMLDTERGKSILGNLIEKLNIKTVILDSMVRLMEGQEDKASDVRKVFDTLKFILERSNCSFIILHHTTKEIRRGFGALRGSGDFAAFADVILMLESRNRALELSMEKNRHIDISQLQKLIVQIRHRGASDESITFQYSGNKDKDISAEELCKNDLKSVLKNQKIENFGTFSIFGILRKKGYAKKTIYAALWALCNSGEIIKIGRGKYAVNAELLTVDIEDLSGL